MGKERPLLEGEGKGHHPTRKGKGPFAGCCESRGGKQCRLCGPVRSARGERHRTFYPAEGAHGLCGGHASRVGLAHCVLGLQKARGHGVSGAYRDS